MTVKGILVLIPRGGHNGGDDDPTPPASSARAACLRRALPARERQVLRAVPIRTRLRAA